MSGTDDWMRQLNERKRQQETDAAERKAAGQRRAAAEQERLAELHRKWAADRSVIDAIVEEVQSSANASGLQVELTFKHGPGSPGTTIGVAQLTAQSARGAPDVVFFNIHVDGTVRAFRGQGATQRRQGDFPLEKADREMYEKYVRDLVESVVLGPGGIQIPQ